MKSVNHVFLSIDEGRTSVVTIQHIYQQLHHKYQLAFENGGDQGYTFNTDSKDCQELGITLLDG